MYVSVFWLMPRLRIASKAHAVSYTKSGVVGAIVVADRTLCGVAIPFSVDTSIVPIGELCCKRCEKILAKKGG